MASLIQMQKVTELRQEKGWVVLNYSDGDPMKRRFGGPVIMMDQDTLQVFKVYASGEIVSLIENGHPK